MAHAEQQRTLRSVDVFMHLTRRMDTERARHDIERAAWQPHLSAAGEAEVNLSGMRVTVIGADLAGLPASHGVIAGLPAADIEFGEDFLDVLLGIPLLLFLNVERVHLQCSRIPSGQYGARAEGCLHRDTPL